MSATAPPVPRLALALVAVLLLAACSTIPAEDGAPPQATGTPTATPTPLGTPTPAATPEPSPTPDPTEMGEDEDGVEPLAGEATTEEREEDAEVGMVALTDVRIATHDGFDRVVLDIAGDGAVGWIARYQDEAREAGRGEVIEVDGELVLNVALQGVTLPPELPEDIEPAVDERWPAPGDGVVTEVVSDTIFEGVQAVFIGVDAERPFLIERLSDPQRVVIDVLHD